MLNKVKIYIMERYLSKLLSISEKGINKSNYELSLSALSAFCYIQYSINQVYTDKMAEEYLLEIGKNTVVIPNDYKFDDNTILFYDGFGLDLRGWAASFARAFSELNYKVVYIEPLTAYNKIPHIISELSKLGGIVEYIDYSKGNINHILELNKFILRYKPKVAFFYTTPNDVSGATVFNLYKDKIVRIQVDLTDHAFWIGVNAFDYGVVVRELGASNMIYNRGVSKNKVKVLDCTPYINNDDLKTPFPFNLEKEKYFFSGGALYKTLGDKELLFYKIAEHILLHNSNIKFLYAGSGDCSELEKLSKKFPNRVYFIEERADFFKMFKNCVFYLNTYPMFGGLMMRYSALAEKVPLTLKHKKDHEGILFDQESLGIEFDTLEEIVNEADLLITDDNYRINKEKKLKDSIISEERFSRNLFNLIENGNTEFVFEKINEIDTKEFRREYIVRLKPYRVLISSIANKKNYVLFTYFPFLFITKAVLVLKRRIQSLLKGK